MSNRDDAPADPSYARAIPPVVTLLIVAAYGVAGWRSAAPARELEWLRDLPRADAAAATDRPAIYAGKLRGPEGRVTPSGKRAAAYWWRVARRDDDSDTVFCSGRERSRLALETPTGSMRIAFTEADPSEVGLITDKKDDEHGRPIAIDLGHTQSVSLKFVPAGLCASEDAAYEQLAIPDGADVEVVGCLKNGVIERCDTPLSGVVATPDLKAYRRHRLGDVIALFMLPLVLVALILMAAGFAIIVSATEMRRSVRPKRGA
jgi:hypothetical protein